MVTVFKASLLCAWSRGPTLRRRGQKASDPSPLSLSGNLAVTLPAQAGPMKLNGRTPRELQDGMDAQLRCAALVETDEVMTMHHDLALLYRQEIRSAVLLGWTGGAGR